MHEQVTGHRPVCTAHSRRRLEQTLEMQSTLCPIGGARDLFSELESGSASRGHPHPRTPPPPPCNLLALESPAAFDLLHRQPHGLVARSGLELKSLVLLGPRVVPNPRLTTPVVPHLLGQHGLSYYRGKCRGGYGVRLGTPKTTIQIGEHRRGGVSEIGTQRSGSGADEVSRN